MPDQFYYTQCRPETSVTGHSDYNIRAASVPRESLNAHSLLSMFEDLTQYYLPSDMENVARKGNLAVENAPVRLARTPSNDNRVAVVHSVFRPTDTEGRKLSHFSHIVLPKAEAPSPSPEEVLARWGAFGNWASENTWVWSDQDGGTKKLPEWVWPRPCDRDQLSERVLRDYLRGQQNAATNHGSNLKVVPNRLVGEVHYEQRRELLVFLLRQYAERRRVLLVAEPGLAALLTYGLVKLLPTHLTDSLTFSTYEPAQNNCYQQRLRQLDIVNTYCDSQEARLRTPPNVPECVSVLNTFSYEQSTQCGSADEIVSYAKYALDLVEAGEFAELERRWERWERVVGRADYDMSEMLGIWKQQRELDELLRQTDTPDELLHPYLENPEWREAVFDNENGRRLTVEYVAKTCCQSENSPEWWPQSPHDNKPPECFRRYLSHFRELVLSTIVTLFSDKDTFSGTFAEAEKDLNLFLKHLLPGVCDGGRTKDDLELDLISRLESTCRESGVQSKLPWQVRAWALGCLCGLQRSSEYQGRVQQWLRVRDGTQLQELARLSIGPSWKAKAILDYMRKNERSEEKTAAKVLFDNPNVNRNFFQLLLEEIDSQDDRQKLVLRVWNALENNTQRCTYWQQIASVEGFPRMERKFLYLEFMNHLITNYQYKPVDWESFFPEKEGDPCSQLFTQLTGKVSNQDRKLKEVDRKLRKQFWSMCVLSLDESCLSDGGRKAPILRTLRTLRKYQKAELEIPESFPDPHTRKARYPKIELQDWLSVDYLLRQKVPAKNKSRWYMAQLAFMRLPLQNDVPELVCDLLRQCRSSRNEINPGQLAEVIECARAMMLSEPHNTTRLVEDITRGLLLSLRGKGANNQVFLWKVLCNLYGHDLGKYAISLQALGTEESTEKMRHFLRRRLFKLLADQQDFRSSVSMNNHLTRDLLKAVPSNVLEDSSFGWDALQVLCGDDLGRYELALRRREGQDCINRLKQNLWTSIAKMQDGQFFGYMSKAVTMDVLQSVDKAQLNDSTVVWKVLRTLCRDDLERYDGALRILKDKGMSSSGRDYVEEQLKQLKQDQQSRGNTGYSRWRPVPYLVPAIIVATAVVSFFAGILAKWLVMP